mgnify:FL=1
MKKYKKIFLFSDFNLDLFNDFLENQLDKRKFKIVNSEYNQIDQFLRKSDLKKKEDNHILFQWISGNYFFKILKKNNYNKKYKKEFNNYIDEFIENTKKKSSIYEYILMPSITIDNNYRENNIFDLKKNMSEKNLIDEINFKLKKAFNKYNNIFIIDINNWIQNLGKKSFNRKMWYSAKIPYSFDFFKLAAQETVKIIDTLYLENKKLIILDLDNTLWGGILGDDGYDGINLGGHDPVGEAYQDFQRELLKLKQKGLILAICSKNNEKNVEEVFKKNKNMILRDKDFAIKKINWHDKAKNINEILNELNLKSNSAVFLDDSKHERERVKTVFDEIVVPDLPLNPMGFVDFILQQPLLNIKAQTKEDETKTKLYHDEAKRKKLKLKIKSNEDWLNELKISVNVYMLNNQNLERTIQLLNKTNQFNLRTNRYSVGNFKKIYTINDNKIFIFEVTDKFGSAGIISIVGIFKKKKRLYVNDFVMSCRVFGREIEFGILHCITKIAKKENIETIEFDYKKTKKNLPTIEFLKKTKMKIEKNKFIWKNLKEYTKPNHLKINYNFLDEEK